MRLKRIFKLLSIIIAVFCLMIIGLNIIKDFSHNKNDYDNPNIYQSQINTSNEVLESDSNDEVDIKETNSNSVTPDNEFKVDDVDKKQEIINNNDNNNNNNNGNSTSNKQEVNKEQQPESNKKEEIPSEIVEEKNDIPIQKIEFANSFEYAPFHKNNKEKYIDFQNVIFYPSDATNKEVVWSSSDPGIVSIESGKIKLNDFGKVTITATSLDGNCSASYEIEVVGEIQVVPYIAKAYDGSVLFLIKISTAQWGKEYSDLSKRFLSTAKFYKDNELIEESEFIKDNSYNPSRIQTDQYKMFDCITGEYYMEFTVIDQLSGYQVSGNSYSRKKITCGPYQQIN